MNADGYISVVARLKDVIIRGGENIYLAEIEEELRSHHQVLDACVMGVPDPFFGEESYALLVLRDGAVLDEDDLSSFLRAKLSHQKIRSISPPWTSCPKRLQEGPAVRTQGPGCGLREEATAMNPRTVRAPTGHDLSCQGWAQEAALRMLMNNLDPEVAERPEDLVVYGGSGKAARSWPAFDGIVRALRRLGDDETLLVQSGQAAGVWPTDPWAPRVLIANSNIVPQWANWPEFHRLEAAGLTMYGQMTAGSWMFVGSQALLQTTYETFAAVGRDAFGSSLAGTLTVTAGLGGAGGAQPLAITMNGGAALCADVDPAAIERRTSAGYLAARARSLDEAIKMATTAKQQREALSVGVVANGAEVLEKLSALEVDVDIVTDQTPAHDPLAYVPAGLSLPDAVALRASEPDDYVRQSVAGMCRHVEAMVGWQDKGAQVFEYGNGLRRQAHNEGCDRAFAFPGFVTKYIRPLFLEGRGPFRWVALSGDARDIHAMDEAVLRELRDSPPVARWLGAASERVRFQGLPARVCWLGFGERERVGAMFNDMVAAGQLRCPVVLCRGHEDSGSVASPDRETEAMMDGSDAIADWPILNALLNACSGGTWVSLHDGGGVGVGRSIHAGVAVVADGTGLAAQKLHRVLRNDPGLGIVRHANAGYERSRLIAAENGLLGGS
jgi:urocanate hydratase